jgi:hypothetical protein
MLAKIKNNIKPKLSDFIFYLTVAADFLPDFVIQAGSLRFLPFNKFPTISRKLRNLQVAATKIAQFRLR